MRVMGVRWVCRKALTGRIAVLFRAVKDPDPDRCMDLQEVRAREMEHVVVESFPAVFSSFASPSPLRIVERNEFVLYKCCMQKKIKN